ncbi:TPA: preprotein translocase subunit YajC, partial [Listeria monocytogenes]|nr:preprotein translocase subunit YajC [Listeria monocytogenes]HEM1636873.1 preprotein translocase subunit YajC [Listeria monocytogenes]
EDGTVILKCGNSKLTFDRNAIRTVLEKGNAVSNPVVAETTSDDTEVVEDNK